MDDGQISNTISSAELTFGSAELKIAELISTECATEVYENDHVITTYHCTKKATVHQVTTMLATSKNVLFPGHNHHANERHRG